MSTDVEARRWRLRAFKKVDGKEVLVHEQICIGDRALSDATKRLEQRGLRLTARTA